MNVDPSRRYDVVQMTSVHPVKDTRIFLKISRSLVASGRSVALVAPHDCDETLEGVDVLGVPWSSGRIKRMAVTTWRVLCRALKSGAPICHIHDPELMPAAILLRLLGRKVIFDVHEDLPRQIETKAWIPAPIRYPVAALSEIAETLTAAAVTNVIGATPTIARRFPTDKTVLVQNFPILGELRSNRPLPAEGEKAFIAYVGNVTPERGGLEMIQAIGQLDSELQPQFEIAGIISPSSLHDAMQRLPGWSRVIEHGHRSRVEVRDMFKRARLGLVLFKPAPNHINAQPNKLFEYMSAGLPVIASNFPLWAEIVEGAGAGLLVDPLDPKAIATAIDWMLRHPIEAAAMGERGYQAVLEKYSWQSEEGTLLTLYDSLSQPT